MFHPPKTIKKNKRVRTRNLSISYPLLISSSWMNSTKERARRMKKQPRYWPKWLNSTISYWWVNRTQFINSNIQRTCKATTAIKYTYLLFKILPCFSKICFPEYSSNSRLMTHRFCIGWSCFSKCSKSLIWIKDMKKGLKTNKRFHRMWMLSIKFLLRMRIKIISITVIRKNQLKLQII